MPAEGVEGNDATEPAAGPPGSSGPPSLRFDALRPRSPSVGGGAPPEWLHAGRVALIFEPRLDTTRGIMRFVLSAFAFATVAAAASGCTLITDVDRSKIEDPNGPNPGSGETRETGESSATSSAPVSSSSGGTDAGTGDSGVSDAGSPDADVPDANATGDVDAAPDAEVVTSGSSDAPSTSSPTTADTVSSAATDATSTSDVNEADGGADAAVDAAVTN